MNPYYKDDAVTIYHGDACEIAPQLGRFDLVLTDPPYGKVKGEFDQQWTNRPAMLADCETWRDLIVAAMKPNATLYWFAWPSLAGRIESLIAEKLNPLQHIIWRKPCPTAQKHSPERLRAPAAETERILMAEHYGADNMALGESGYVAKCDELRAFVFEPLRKYLSDEWERAGLKRSDADKCTGSQMSGHYFTSSQWALPTEDVYKKLQARANINGGEYLRREYEYLRREYKYLRREYEDLRREYEDLRRYFELEKGDPKTEIWNFSPDQLKLGHPTPKPEELIRFMVRISCRPGGTILDPFAGSGTSGRAAKDLGRKAVLIEREERYCEIAANRLAQEVLPLF
jgi:adenine-specific DNA-methyltransferase